MMDRLEGAPGGAGGVVEASSGVGAAAVDLGEKVIFKIGGFAHVS